MLIYCNGDSFTSGHGMGDFLMENELEYVSSIKWYQAVIQIKDFCRVNDIPLFWIDSINEKLQMLNDITHEDVIRLSKYADIRYAVSMSDFVKPNIKSYVVDGHFSGKIHTDVALAINNIITKEIYGKDTYNR